ncbi:hypothetical protein GCM10020331_058130 [Ectobacillus funiculus]
MNIQIRISMEKKDIPQLSNLMIQYIVDFYQRPRPDEEALRQLIQHIQCNPSSGLQFVAEQNGKLIGFATLYFAFSTLQLKRTAILNDLFVVPDARGKKAGEQLFRACLSYIREKGLCVHDLGNCEG